MSIERLIAWPFILVSYGALALAMLQGAAGQVSGWTSLCLLFSILVGAPVLMGHAGWLWRKKLLAGAGLWLAALCALYPLLLALTVCAFYLHRRLPWF